MFALGGFGQAFLVAAKAGDLMVIMGVTIATVILIAVVNLITDVCYALLNPQIRLTSRNQRCHSRNPAPSTTAHG